MGAPPARAPASRQATGQPDRAGARPTGPLAAVVRPLVPAPTTTRPAPRAPTPASRARPVGFDLAKVAIEAPPAPADPATLVEAARAAPPVALPHRAAAARLFGVGLDGIEAHTGEHARLACRRLGASAVAVRNVVLFADDAPDLDLVVHEVAHVLQQDGLGDRAPRRFAPGSLRTSVPGEPAEREAAAAARTARTVPTAPRPAPAPPLRLRRAAIALYRNTPDDTTADKVEPAKPAAPELPKIELPKDLTDVSAKRLWLFSQFSTSAATTLTADQVRFGERQPDGSYKPEAFTSPKPWRTADYVKYFTRAEAPAEGVVPDDGVAKLQAAGLAPIEGSTAEGDVSSKNVKRLAKRLHIVNVLAPPAEETGSYAFAPKYGQLALHDLRNPEHRLRTFKADPTYGLQTQPQEEPGADGKRRPFGLKLDPKDPDIADEKWAFKFDESSNQPFLVEQYRAVVKDYPIAGDDYEGDPSTAFNLQLGAGTTLARAVGLARVGANSDARTYVFIGRPRYEELVQSALKLPKTKRTPAQLIADYRAILLRVDRLKQFSATLPDRDPDHKTKDDAGRPDKKDARHARRQLMKLIVDNYDDKQGAAFFKEIIDLRPDLFGSTYARIKGNVFEKWIFERRFAGKTGIQLIKAQPYFEWDEAGATPESERIKKVRFGDGVLRSQKDHVILEAKAYRADKVPTLGNEKSEDAKDDDLVLQMKDYATIIASVTSDKPIYGRYLVPAPTAEDDELEAELEDNPTQKAGAQEPNKELFKYIVYEFADVEIAKKWQHALQKTLAKVYATDPTIPGDEASDKVRTIIGFNPSLEIDLPKGGELEHKITSFPKFKQPGVVMKEANLKLALPGKPLLAPGSSLLMDIDMKGLEQRDVVKPIEPVVEAGAAKGKAKPEQLHGRAPNKFSGLKSALSNFLKRIHTDARLVGGQGKDAGVEAEITISDGPSGIPGLDLVGTMIKARYVKQLEITGTIGLQRPDQKIAGSVSVAYEKGDFTFKGKATVKDLIPNLDPFTVEAYVRGDEKRLSVDKVKLSRKIGGVTLTGQLTKVSYDLATSAFGADIHVDADVGAFGKIGADGKVANNELQQLTFSYQSKKLAYPKNKPIISGDLEGSVTWEKGKLSGHIGGNARLQIPALDKIAKGLSDLAFVVNVDVSDTGTISGSIATATDQPIALGKYFRIPKLALELHPDGTITSRFTLAVENLKYVKEARVECEITSAGVFRVLAASAKAKFGDETKDRVAAELALSYDSSTAAFIISGALWVRIKEGMVGKGTFVWNLGTGKMDAELGIDKITLLSYSGHRDFLKFKKQIELVMIYVLGLYLQVSFELGFKYNFRLAITPKVKLTGLKWDDNDDLTFERAVATVKLEGLLEAALTGTPGIGLGLFALSTLVLRGGGGIKVPIAATARAKPEGTVQVKYRPDGTLEGGGRVGITLTFGIKGEIVPYAELSVLNGVWEPTWTGSPIYSFVILEEKALYTHYIDFGAPLEKEENPRLPDNDHAKAPPKKHGDEKEHFESKAEGDKGAEPQKGKRKEELPTSADAEKPKNEKGFDFEGLIAKLGDQPKFKPIKTVFEIAKVLWNVFGGLLEPIIGFFKFWLDVAIEGVELFIELLQTIAKKGLLAAFKQLLERLLGEFYYVVAPLFDALEKIFGKFSDRLEKLMTNPIPKTVVAFLGWALDTLVDVVGLLVGSLTDLAEAIGKVILNAIDAAPKFINYLVKKGKIGVRRHVYYIPRPIVSNIYFYAPTEYKVDVFGFKSGPWKEPGNLVGLSDITSPSKIARKALAFALWLALDNIDAVKPSHESWQDEDDPDVGSERRNYWFD